MVNYATHSASTIQELLRLKGEYLIPCVYHFYQNPPHIVAGDGCYLIDDEGRRYLDCYSGVTVTSAGHCNPAIIEPVIEQIRILDHTTSIYLTEPVLKLAEALAGIAPGNLKKSFFCASGSEAVEGALLLASLHTGKSGVVAMTNSLHGRTRWAMSVTGLPMWRTDPDPISGVYHVPFTDVGALEQCLLQNSHQVGAVIAEPIQGNGGIVVPPDDYWPAVRRLCDRHGVLLVMDEVQSGFNRTGRWFACEHWGVVPDIMAISKAMGNGFPIAAFMTNDRIAASYTRPGASTYGGNPVAAAAALAVIQFHQENKLGEQAQVMGQSLHNLLIKLSANHRDLAPPRGVGLMWGLPVIDRNGNPSPTNCDRYLENLKDNGALVGKTGPDRNILTFMPPLTISLDQIGEIHDALEKSID